MAFEDTLRYLAVTEQFVELEGRAGAPRTDDRRAFRTRLFSEWS